MFSGHGNVSRQTSSGDDKENYSSAPSGDDQARDLAAKNEKISVKERTKTFNRMASEVRPLFCCFKMIGFGLVYGPIFPLLWFILNSQIMLMSILKGHSCNKYYY